MVPICTSSGDNLMPLLRPRLGQLLLPLIGGRIKTITICTNTMAPARLQPGSRAGRRNDRRHSDSGSGLRPQASGTILVQTAATAAAANICLAEFTSSLIRRREALASTKANTIGDPFICRLLVSVPCLHLLLLLSPQVVFYSCHCSARSILLARRRRRRLR